MHPRVVNDTDNDFIAVVSNEGRMLVFAVKDLPEMARGKGNKMMSIPSARVQDRVEFVQDMQVLGPNDTLVVHAGRRHLNLKPADLEHYMGERGRRGAKLPRGFQNVDALAVERKES
jgi:topoisomerase-4 subunit A